MTDTRKTMQQALELCERIRDEREVWSYQELRELCIALRSALWQQDDLSNASKSEQLLASHDHALRAEFQRTKAALAQQGEPVAKYIGECSDGSLVQLYEDLKKGTELYAGAAPAAQPNAKQAAEAVGQEFAKVFGHAPAAGRSLDD